MVVTIEVEHSAHWPWYVAWSEAFVLAISSMSVDEIKNTQKNDSRGKKIVANP
jgi:hypothetical protein